MTSEKMNHIIPIRKLRSTAMLYMPASLSLTTVPNQNMNRPASITNPGTRDQAGSQEFSVAIAPAMIVNKVTEP